MTSALPIDMVSDVVCPWCFIGKRRLEKAIALQPDIAVEAARDGRLHENFAVRQIRAFGEIELHQPLFHRRRGAAVARPQN